MKERQLKALYSRVRSIDGKCTLIIRELSILTQMLQKSQDIDRALDRMHRLSKRLRDNAIAQRKRTEKALKK